MMQLTIESLREPNIDMIRSLYLRGELPLPAFINPLTKQRSYALLYLSFGRTLQKYLGIAITNPDAKIAGGRCLSAELKIDEHYFPIVVGVTAKRTRTTYYFKNGERFGEPVRKRRAIRKPSDFLRETLAQTLASEDPFILKDERL
jgi:hypothetical protein